PHARQYDQDVVSDRLQGRPTARGRTTLSVGDHSVRVRLCRKAVQNACYRRLLRQYGQGESCYLPSNPGRTMEAGASRHPLRAAQGDRLQGVKGKPPFFLPDSAVAYCGTSAPVYWSYVMAIRLAPPAHYVVV